MNVAEKLADFPMQTAYKHLHFGLWNGLSGSGANKIADLGIGFVTATADGMGMTGSDMPNVGTATYNGAFFGPLAAEAGGVFDYTSKDMKAGEFRGAFGGDK